MPHSETIVRSATLTPQRSPRSRNDLRVESLVLEFPGRRGAAPSRVLDGLDLSVGPGELVCLLGPSGCGKTTLLNCIAGFVTPTAGRVLAGGEPVTGPDSRRGVVFQHHALMPWYTVRRNVALGLRLRGVARGERAAIADHHLQMVGLGDSADLYPHQLSGGMAQRVGIARVFANDPDILLMDEPFGALDALTREEMQDQLVDLWRQTAKTCVFVTHSVQEAVYLADRVVVMSRSAKRPARVVPIDLPRPRMRTDEAFATVYREVDRVLREALA
jgi:ABC-type nitrate/sulfonate/bicarbonate transport system ATPase subunit